MSAEQIYPLPSGDPTITTQVTASIWVMWSVSTVFLAIRVYCRAYRTQKMWWDDYLLIVGWVFLLTSVCLQHQIFHDGYLVTALGGPKMTPMNLASDTSMKMSLAFSKTSFAVTLLRFSNGWFRHVIVGVTVIMDAMCLVHGILVWRANCGSESPFTFSPCWPVLAGIYMNMVGSIISAISDFILTLIPIKVVWGLQMIKREKIGVAVAMSMGVLAGVVAVVKAAEAYQVTQVVGTGFSFRLARLSILIHAEPNAAIIAACIPVLRVLFRDVKTYYSGNSNQRQYLKSNQQSGFHSNMPHSVSEVRAEGHDDDSEASILAGDKAKHGITRVRQVTVDYEDRGIEPGNGIGEAIEMTSRGQRRRQN